MTGWTENVRKRRNSRIREGKKRGATAVVEQRRRKRERTYGRSGRGRREEVRDARKPVVETRMVKKGGSGFQVPQPRKKRRRRARATKHLIEGAETRIKKKKRTRDEARYREVRAVVDQRTRAKQIKKGRRGERGGASPDSVVRVEQRHKAARANKLYVTKRWY
jgi:ribosomal protein S7